ncbi:MAG: hypothetical protein IJK28_11105 [Clostridia bacterium]|nr:hypothetical protein [Clostridia bacterium]
MDLQKIITDLVAKLTGNNSLIAKFKKNPIETIKGLLGNVNLDSNQLKSVADGVAAKLNLDDVVKQGGGILAKIKGLFGKK